MTAARLVLASASPRRHELLGRMGLVFEVVTADVDEIDDSEHGPEHFVLHNAGIKATAVAAQRPDCLVLGADTAVVIDGAILGKPADLDQAVAMLERLSGREHRVLTGVALHWREGDLCTAFAETSRVRFKRLTRAQIEDYFTIVDPLDKAGAYGIQAGRERIVAAVDGSVENVMGLPVQRLGAWFAGHGFDFRESGD